MAGPMTEELNALLTYCREQRRLCPMPMRWNELYKRLPQKRRNGMGWESPLPLVLAAWHGASDKAKQDRLELHLLWAAEHNALGPISQFLHSLPKAEWYHAGE
jgi:hypothetical protein